MTTTEEQLKMQELARIIKYISQLEDKEEFVKQFQKKYGYDISKLISK